jgi:predicted nucleic acid-binding protein
MIASVSGWHEHHIPAAAETNRRLDAGEPLFVAAPALVEAYAVLTRLPPPYRLPPAEALALLETSFVQTARAVVALDPPSYVALLRRARAEGIAGGRIYDAVIATCAQRAGATALLTFNVAHFRPLVGPLIEVLAPAP